MARMKNAGMDIRYSDAAKLAQQSKAALLERLHKGGESMPPFPQLDNAEIRALMEYLNRLAGIPDTSTESLAVNESRARVGELIVNSTCHTCHSATGTDPGPQELMDGAIPPLSKLTTRKDQSEFIRKVTAGAPVLMGTPPLLYRGRMPVFFYLSQEEAADVYLYLTEYPPTEQPQDRPLLAASLAAKRPTGKGPGAPQTAVVASDIDDKDNNATSTAEFEWVALLIDDRSGHDCADRWPDLHLARVQTAFG